MTNYIYFTDNDLRLLCLRYNDRGWFTDPDGGLHCLANSIYKGWSWVDHKDEYEFKVLVPMVLILNEEETK